MEPKLDERDLIVRAMVKGLPNQQRRATILRFWENKSIFEIAKSLRVSWCEADEILKEAIQTLRRDIENHPRVSHALKTSKLR